MWTISMKYGGFSSEMLHKHKNKISEKLQQAYRKTGQTSKWISEHEERPIDSKQNKTQGGKKKIEKRIRNSKDVGEYQMI